MRFGEAYRRTLKEFEKSLADLAESTEISVSTISKFCQGNNERIMRVEALVEALPIEARRYFMELVISSEM